MDEPTHTESHKHFRCLQPFLVRLDDKVEAAAVTDEPVLPISRLGILRLKFFELVDLHGLPKILNPRLIPAARGGAWMGVDRLCVFSIT